VTEWSLDEVLGYLGSWSAVQRYKDARVRTRCPRCASARRRLGTDATRRLRWPIHLRLGRV
jgi:hypothetical protein